MHCNNCGAPLELADGRIVLTCEYCQSSQRLESPLDDADRVISLDRPCGVDCPSCGHELTEASLDGKRARFCPECLGILVESPIFAEVVRARRAAYRGREIPVPALDPTALQRAIECPVCNLPMEVHHHAGAGRAVIDSCHHCHLVWLDQSEIASIERTPGIR